jgi:hypothetical protein
VAGSLGFGDPVYGLSDIDLVVVVPGRPRRPGDSRERVKRRWLRLERAMPRLAELLFDVAVCEDEDLRDSVDEPAFTYGLGGGNRDCRAAYFGPAARRDVAGLRQHPGVHRPMANWRLLAGPDRRPPTAEPDPQRRRVAAWLELQWWWRYAFRVCVDATGPRTASLCLKLITEPLRAWIWLTQEEQVFGRRELLERALTMVPEEEQALRRALELDRALPRSPQPPLAEALAFLVRLSSRIAGRLVGDGERAGGSEVRLLWGDRAELILPSGARRARRSEPSDGRQLLPLVDWRAIVVPRLPDEAFAVVEGDPGSPTVVGRAAAAATGEGAYPVLRGDELLVLPTTDIHREGLLRAVQCRVTDPVSFALLEDRPTTTFPDLRGWSARDVARRATAEHRAWLERPGPPVRSFLAPENASAALLETARLFTAARAALFHQSLEGGAPELLLTVGAVAEHLTARDKSNRVVVEEAHASYRSSRIDGSPCPPDTIAHLREIVLGLPVYAGARRASS